MLNIQIINTRITTIISISMGFTWVESNESSKCTKRRPRGFVLNKLRLKLQGAIIERFCGLLQRKTEATGKNRGIRTEFIRNIHPHWIHPKIHPHWIHPKIHPHWIHPHWIHPHWIHPHTHPHWIHPHWNSSELNSSADSSADESLIDPNNPNTPNKP